MKIAVIDSGINAADPHVRAVAGGIGALSLEGWTDDISDRLGHGTAVAAVIREKVPDTDLYAVKVFDRGLSVRAPTVLRALYWCQHYNMDLVCLSAGSGEVGQDSALESALEGLLVVSPADHLPSRLPRVIAVEADETCPRDEFRYYDGVFHASPCPPPTAGFRYEGVDIAVANMTGFVARALPCILREGQSITAARDRLMWELASLREARKI